MGARHRWGNGAWHLLCLTFLFALASGWAPARANAAPATHENRVIHACYGPADQRELHVVAGTRCPAGQALLSWNQQGPAGAAGSTTSGAGATLIFAPSLANASPGTTTTTRAKTTSNTKNSTTTSSTTTTTSSSSHTKHTFWGWVSGAASALGNALLLIGLGLLALSILLVPISWLLARQSWGRWARRWPLRWLGPTLQIQPFEDSAMASRLGPSFSLLTQARIGGGREEGLHLYLVTGEDSPGTALADLQSVPHTQALAAALYLLRLTARRRRLLVNGSLFPAGAGDAAAVAVSLRRSSKSVDAAEFRLSDPPPRGMSAATSNRILAVAAAGWIEHAVVDQTPGPSGHEVFLSADPRSWGMFRAGAELNRMSYLSEAADQYEQALAIDGQNVGALIDLAHLRRRENRFPAAEALASDAIELIEARNAAYKRRKDDEDPNWYRAKIVLATTYAEWAKHLEANGDAAAAERSRDEAYKLSATVASRAIDAIATLEGLVKREKFKRAIDRREKLGRFVRGRAWLLARLRGRRFEAPQAVELYGLLRTTFLPGLLLLVAANGKNRGADPPLPQRLPASQRLTPKQVEAALDTLSQGVVIQLAIGASLRPKPLISYVLNVPLKSPRVVYNLACCYGIAARSGPTNREPYLEEAAEFLRQSIVRSPPPERRSLLTRAWEDGDLEALRESRPEVLYELSQFVPRHPS